MKLKERLFNPYGLQVRLILSLALSAVLCVAAFLILDFGLDVVFSDYYEKSDFERIHIQRQFRSLQDYINTNNISSENLQLLKAWEKTQPVILLELYNEDICIYSSIYEAPVSSLMLDDSINSENISVINLMDGQAVAFIYSDFTYQFSVIRTAVSLITALVIFILLFLHSNQKMIRYICRLNEEVQILEGGNLDYSVSVEGNDEITDLAKSMNRMKSTLLHQMETEQNLYQTNRQLITEMSHDMRTPLTGIILYLEILRSHRYDSEEELQDYLRKIETKANNMKLLSERLFEYSLANTFEVASNSQTMEKVFKDSINNLIDDLKYRGFSIKSEIEWKNCYIQVNMEYVNRIFENIISNIDKYANRSIDIRIYTIYSDKYCGLSVMNSLSTINTNVESNGIGIESIKSLMRQMDGLCNAEQTEDAFEISVLFPKQ